MRGRVRSRAHRRLRELITDRQLPGVATGRPGATPDTCYVSTPAYRKSPPLSVLFSMFLHAGPGVFGCGRELAGPVRISRA